MGIPNMKRFALVFCGKECVREEILEWKLAIEIRKEYKSKIERIDDFKNSIFSDLYKKAFQKLYSV